MVCERFNCYFDFWLFFALPDPPPQPSSQPKKQNFKKLKKIPGDIIILHMCTKNYDEILYYTNSEIWRATDEQTDGKSDI